jgi:hypothetical protein
VDTIIAWIELIVPSWWIHVGFAPRIPDDYCFESPQHREAYWMFAKAEAASRARFDRPVSVCDLRVA